MRAKRLAGLGLVLTLGTSSLVALPSVARPARAAVQASPVVTATKPKIRKNLSTYKMVTVNRTATFKVKAKGGKLKYQWYYVTGRGGYWKKVPGKAGKRSYLKVKAKISKTGYRYRVRVSNYKGRKYSRLSWLLVRSSVRTPYPRNRYAVTPHWAIATASASYTGSRGPAVVHTHVALQNFKYRSRNPRGNVQVLFRGNNGQLFGDRNANGTYGNLGYRGVNNVGSVGKSSVKVASAIFVVPAHLLSGGRIVVKDVASPRMTNYHAL